MVTRRVREHDFQYDNSSPHPFSSPPSYSADVFDQSCMSIMSPPSLPHGHISPPVLRTTISRISLTHIIRLLHGQSVRTSFNPSRCMVRAGARLL